MADGLVALPADARTREQFDWIAEQVREANGTAGVWLARPSSDAQERELARSMQANSGGANAGFESVELPSPSASASQNPTAAGGAEMTAPATAVERGDQGTPQSLLSQGNNLPSPIGQGSGPTVGSTSVGPQRNTSDAGSEAGLAAAGTVFGRPGRGRTSGNAVIAAYKLTTGALAQVWAAVSGAANPLAGQTVDHVLLSHGDSTQAQVVTAVLVE